MPKRMALLLLPTMVATMMMVRAGPALADAADLQQAISDLGSQASDKERIDAENAARIELNEVRTWLQDATNKLKEEEEEWCRLVLERVRAQLRMVDQLISLSSLTPSGVTSNTQPCFPAQTSVLPFGRRCTPEMKLEKNSVGFGAW